MVANHKKRGKADGTLGLRDEDWSTDRDQLEKLLKQVPAVWLYIKSAAVWEKTVFQCAVVLGCTSSLLTSVPIPADKAWEYVIEGKKAATKDSTDEKAYLKKMSGALTPWQKKMLEHHETDWEFVIDPRFARLENSETKLKRVVMMKWIHKSLEGSVFAGYKQILAPFIPLDYAKVYSHVLKKGLRSRQIEVGHLCREADLHVWTPGRPVMTWQAKDEELKEDIEKIAPGIDRETARTLIFLATAYSDSTYSQCLEEALIEDTRKITEYMDDREEKMEIRENWNENEHKEDGLLPPEIPPPRVTFLTRTKLISLMTEVQTAKDQLRSTNAKLRAAGPGRDKGFPVNDRAGGKPGVCFQWRDKGVCEFENCKYSHDGPKGQQAGKGKPGAKKACTICGKKNHATEDCFVGQEGKKEKQNKFKQKSSKAGKATEEKGSPRHAAQQQAQQRKGGRAFMAKWIVDSEEEASVAELRGGPEELAPDPPMLSLSAQSTSPTIPNAPTTATTLPKDPKEGFAGAGKQARAKKTFRSLIDSGTNRNCTTDANFLTSGRKRCHTKLMGIEKSEGDSMTCTLEGTMDLSIGGYPVPHKRTLYSKNMSENLSSVTEEVDQGVTTIFDASGCYKVRSESFKWVGDVLAKVDRNPDDDLWYIEWDLDETGRACVAKHQRGFKKECNLSDLNGYITNGAQDAQNPKLASKTLGIDPPDASAEAPTENKAKSSSQEPFDGSSRQSSKPRSVGPTLNQGGPQLNFREKDPKGVAVLAQTSQKAREGRRTIPQAVWEPTEQKRSQKSVDTI